MADNKPTLTLAPKHPQWEYTTGFRGGGQSMDEILNSRGREGWELCAVVPRPPHPTGLDSGDAVYFKRRKQS